MDVAAGGHLPGLALRPDPEEGDPAEVQRVHGPGEAGQVQEVTVTGNEIKGKTTSREAFRTYAPHGLRQATSTRCSPRRWRSTSSATRHPAWANMLISWAPFLLLIGFWVFFMRQMQSGGNKALSFGKSKAKLLASPAEEGHVQGRGRRRRGQGRAAGDHRVPARAPEVPEARRPHPQGRAADGPSGDGQDAAGARDRRRGQRAVLLDLGLGLRRDVRGRGRLARARPVRAGQEERALHHLHRRDRRRRPPSRRRPRRRPRRARADAEPAAGRDGRLRVERRRHPDRGHQPSRRARPGAAAARPLRPPGGGLAARRARPRGHPAGAHAQDPARRGRRHLDAGAGDARLLRRRPREPGERGGAAGRPPQPEVRDRWTTSSPARTRS